MKTEIKKAVHRANVTASQENFKENYTNTPLHKQATKKDITKIPPLYQQNYSTAMLGRSRTAAIKAKCLDCCNWQRVEISYCPVKTCPLYPYRPYRSHENLKTPQKSMGLEIKTVKG